MLTPQQERELRKYGTQQGYSPEKIESFIESKRRATPLKEFTGKSVQPAPKKEGDGFLKSLIKDPIKTLIVKPGVRIGQAGVAAYGAATKNDKALDFSTKDITLDTPFGKYTVEGTKSGKEGIKQVAGDALKSGSELFGGRVAKTGLKIAGKGASRLVRTAAKATSKAPTLVSKVPKAASEAAESFLSTVDERTKTVLNPSRLVPENKLGKLSPPKLQEQVVVKREKFDRYLKQAQKALVNPASDTPLELAGARAEEALKVIGQKMSKRGGQISSVVGEKGSIKLSGLTKPVLSMQKQLKDQVGLIVDKEGVRNAAGRLSKISLDPEDTKLVKKVYDLLGEFKFRDNLAKADDAVDAIQDLLYKRRSNTAVPVNSKVERILKQSIGEMNAIVRKSAGKTYSRANDKYSGMKNVYDELNKMLGKEGSKGGSLMKRVFSPTDSGTKKLFAKVKDITGVDLVEEAALAKHTMEIVGDPRGNNLLELLKQTGIPTPTNIAAGTGKFLLNKARDPLKESYRLIEEGARRINP